MAKVVAEGGVAAGTIGEVRDRLPAPRAAWVMVPAGEATEQVIARLGEQLEPGDMVIDGGNSYTGTPAACGAASPRRPAVTDLSSTLMTPL